MEITVERPVTPPPAAKGSDRLPAAPLKRLVLSRASAGFIGRGHPWVKPDRFTRGLDKLQPGEAVVLVDDQGKPIASALADPKAEVCARVFHRTPNKLFDPAVAVTKAWTRRGGFHKDPKTTCYRIVHGEGDWLPGLRIERLGEVLVVVVSATCMAPFVQTVCKALHACSGGMAIVVREHLDDLRVEATSSWRWNPDGTRGTVDPEAVITAKELGATITLRPFAGLATGIYIDQRETRAWLRKQAKGKRVLNLFAYTGVFSTSLLVGGAAHATDVDISGPSLAIAQANAAANHLTAKHAIAQRESREFLREATGTWDVIICDPPTAAQGDGGWILRRDYPELLPLAWQRLAPGGLLLACCNTLYGKPFPLHEELMKLPGASEEKAPDLGDDLPQLPGYHEGRPFRLLVIRKAG